MQGKKLFFLVSMVFLVSLVAAPSESYWLDKPAWEDRPIYAEEISLLYIPTDLVTEKNTRQVCTGYTNTTTINGTVNRTCDNYGNEFYEGGAVEVLNFTARNEAYLGNGLVRSNLSIGSTEIVLKVLKADTFVSNDSKFQSWFNDRYYYKRQNISASQVDALRSKIKSAAVGDNEQVLATQVNGFSIDLNPFSVSAGLTVVSKFENYRSSSFTVADLVTVQVSTKNAQ